MAIDTIKSTAVLDGAIATADIADDAVTSAKLDTNIAVAGDLTVDTSTLKVDASNNRVGIGTASPGRKLELNNGGTGAFVTFTDGVATNFTFKTDGNQVGTFGTEAGSTHLGFMASGTERVRIHSGGVMSVNNGIELGSGLDATAANVLDDYEEGAWTPFYTSQHGNLSLNGNASNTSSMYSTQAGSYIKIGKKVICHMTLATTGVTSFGGSGNLWVAGLPFATATTTASKPRGVNGCMAGRFNSFTPDQLVCNSNATTIHIRAGFETYPDINKLDVGGSSNRNVIEALIVYETA